MGLQDLVLLAPEAQITILLFFMFNRKFHLFHVSHNVVGAHRRSIAETVCRHLVVPFLF